MHSLHLLADNSQAIPLVISLAGSQVKVTNVLGKSVNSAVTMTSAVNAATSKVVAENVALGEALELSKHLSSSGAYDVYVSAEPKKDKKSVYRTTKARLRFVVRSSKQIEGRECQISVSGTAQSFKYVIAVVRMLFAWKRVHAV